MSPPVMTGEHLQPGVLAIGHALPMFESNLRPCVVLEWSQPGILAIGHCQCLNRIMKHDLCLSVQLFGVWVWGKPLGVSRVNSIFIA